MLKIRSRGSKAGITDRMRLSSWTINSVLCASLALSCAEGCGKPVENRQQISLPNVDALVAEAVVAMDGKRFSDAKLALEQAIATNRLHARAHFLLGVVQAMQGARSAVVVTRWEQALILDPKLVDAYVQLSAWKLQTQDAQGALVTAESGLAIAKRHPDLTETRAWSLDALGRNGEALSAFDEAISLRPDDCKLRVRSAQLLRQAMRNVEALSRLGGITQCRDLQLLSMGAAVAEECDAPAVCTALLDVGIKAQPHPDLYARRGICRDKSKDRAGAIADLKRAIAMDATFASAHHYLGILLRASDKVAACRELALAEALGKPTGADVGARQDYQELGCK